MKLTAPLAALAMTLALAPFANALSTTTYIHDYGIGEVDPGGDDTLGAGFVEVSDQSLPRFIDVFDFGGDFDSITSFDLTLTFSDAGPSGGILCLVGICNERWQLRVPGSDSSFTSETSGGSTGDSNDDFTTLFDSASPQTITFNAASDSGSIDAFSEAVSLGKFIFGFSEKSSGHDQFKLNSAKLEVTGVPTVIPLPAAAWMLLGVSGALVAAKRRSAKRSA